MTAHDGAVTRAPAVARARRSTEASAMIALQRSAGNTSALAVMRRARGIVDEPPVTFTLPGVVDGASVSSWSLGGARGDITELHIMRRSDADSPRLAQASTTGAAAATGTLMVRTLTPLGWIRQLTLTLEDCMVSSYHPGAEYESIGLTFSRMHVEQ
jgi:Type VI secretion system effector, Hcp